AGYQAQPERFLQVMNVFALTSRSEGMPLAVLEAWAAGVPVVASRVGGLPELIADGQTGLLFPPGDENALARALLAILGNPSLAQRLTQAGSYRVHSQFSLARMAADYQTQYLNLLAQKSMAARTMPLRTWGPTLSAPDRQQPANRPGAQGTNWQQLP